MAERIKHPQPHIRDPREWNDIIFHAGGSITVWDVYKQSWTTTATPSDQLLSSLAEVERQMIAVWIGGRN
tara:strand:- start:225 stop:434 length:210 start_codon:yes stop_codon:yes gene_type:complete